MDEMSRRVPFGPVSQQRTKREMIRLIKLGPTRCLGIVMAVLAQPELITDKGLEDLFTHVRRMRASKS